jgi:probable rRNA maturation factor
MSRRGLLVLRNRQRKQPLHGQMLRRVVLALLEELLHQERYNLGVYFVGAGEITRINEKFLRHQGPTDVIAFDYAEPGQSGSLHGDIFVCVDEALVQAPRFRVSWQTELVRYVVHGVLHLRGYDDHETKDRHEMKGAEARLLRRLADRFDLGRKHAKRPRRRKAP